MFGALLVLLPGDPRAQNLEGTFHRERLAAMDAAIGDAIAQKQTPGGVLWLERNGVAYHRALGRRAVLPAVEPMTEDTIFDAASLTKVAATAPAILLLVERGQVGLESPVEAYLPGFKAGGRITIRQLLTHTSGLRAGIPLKPAWSGYEAALRLACTGETLAPPGRVFRYSDVDFILLGEVVQRVSGRRLDDFTGREIFAPLGMTDTGFLPPKEKLGRIAPTERLANGEVLRGQVHDPTARRMGGVAGHAGLFTTAADLARFARMLLNGGELDGKRIFKPETVELMTSVQSPVAVPARRGLGWDIDSQYSAPRGKLFPIGSYGHTGWTGTSMWIDPYSRTFVLFLSNRNHPDERGDITRLRSRLGTLAAEAVVGFDFPRVPGGPVPPR